MQLLSVNSLSKHYRSGSTATIEVFSDISFSIDRGEVVTLTGASGSGKSTLLNIIGTLDSATKGEVSIGGKPLSSLSGSALSQFRNKHIGFIFQFHHLLPEFSAVENVAMPAFIAGVDQSTALSKAQSLLQEIGLAERATHRPSELSGGEAQRVAVARAFIMEPDLVLADEPTGNLDPENSDKLFSLILDLASRRNQTFLIATHNHELAHKATRSMHLEKGSLQ